MAFVIADRVKETTTTTGTGTVTLAGASLGYQSFAAIGNGNSTYYCIAGQTTNEWEVGIGTYTSSGTTLSRDTVLASSNSGSLVTFSAGTKDVFVTQPSERSLLVQSAGTGLFSGTTPFTANGVLYANATSTTATSSNFVYNGTNIGLGGAPSSWGAGYNALQIVRSSFLTDGSNTFVGNNFYWDGTNYKLLTSGGAVSYGQASGVHKFYTSTTGSTGSNITFTERAAIGTTEFVINDVSADYDTRIEGDTDANLFFVDASTDRVGIGTNAPSYKFEVNGAIGFPSSTAPTWSFTIPTIYSNSSVLYLNSGLSFAFLTGTGAGTERVRINSTGIGIGTASPSKALDVVGAITASSDSSFTSTGALLISKGTAAEQPGSPVTGMLRYNTTSNQFEGYSGSSPAWNPVGGASISNDTSTASNLYPTFANATSGTATTIYTSNAKLLYKPSTGELQADVPVAGNGIFVNKTTINTSYTIASGTNGWSVGPITIASGVSVTVASGQKWLVG